MNPFNVPIPWKLSGEAPPSRTKTTKDQSLLVALMVVDLGKGCVWVFTIENERNLNSCNGQIDKKTEGACLSCRRSQILTEMGGPKWRSKTKKPANGDRFFLCKALKELNGLVNERDQNTMHAQPYWRTYWLKTNSWKKERKEKKEKFLAFVKCQPKYGISTCLAEISKFGKKLGISAKLNWINPKQNLSEGFFVWARWVISSYKKNRNRLVLGCPRPWS